ncbi:MAG: hypothetical protein A3A72_06510 [Deltaproteobacteria bacterium RIFCSPLOWO2_01_FULL_38_9]|nr:MAG: hypothetical protein A3A72_06510 [Deltaproteobacteria bacterium RIFCSPLOWO2_01_FULL_38_9]
MHSFQKLALFLRPPGKGIYVVSAGPTTPLPLKVLSLWKKSFSKIPKAKVILLGVPSDCGAGYLRGANMGPLELRKILYQNKTFLKYIKSQEVIDIGDVITIPQLLYDEMLSSKQIQKHRKYLYPKNKAEKLPVSPLSILKDVSKIIFSLNPKAKIITLGGDHSISWPIIQAYHDHFKKTFSILHFDAHTDLLKSRLGIDYCFGTWAYHANDLIERQERLVQVGIRRSGKTKAYWEKTLHVKQFWAKDILKNPKQAQEHILSHLRSLHVNRVYISNDIDGTDMKYAASTGTAEPKGLTPSFISELIQKVGKEFEVIGGDLVEVAPPLHLDHKGEPQKTLSTASTYVISIIQSMTF